VEEIDDDIEATGYIEAGFQSITSFDCDPVQVVKTDDRRVAREHGVHTFPSLIYFRRRNPILYDGDFKVSPSFARLTSTAFRTITDPSLVGDVALLPCLPLLFVIFSRQLWLMVEVKDSTTLWHWLRAHDEVAAWELTDDDFESRTDSHSPDEGALDWLVMFYDSEDPDCNSFIATLETVAHKLRGLVHVGRVDTSVADDVTDRFRIDADSQCPTFLL